MNKQSISEVEKLFRECIALHVETALQEDEIQEFCSVGGGAIMGYSLPLGMNPDDAGRQMNKQLHKKSDKKKKH